ncbi:MAG: hypothetical protein Q9170_007301 [Blastenia crenularia]
MVQPFGNDTIHNTPRWVPEPNGRGTWSLLSTCLVTISLCVWSAVHLNVPQHERTHSQHWRKVKWLVLGLFAPELVAYVAWQQRQEAKKLCREVRAVYGHQRSLNHFTRCRRFLLAKLGGTHAVKSANHSPPASPKLHQLSTSAWEEIHGFLLLMGGFAISTGSNKEQFLPKDLTRAALTPDGLRFLLEHHPEALPDVTTEQIKDKSKADSLKKTLVCAQALWFCAQCITRLAQSLPVSLLELNTFGHALCTLVIYIFWWEKPLDVEEPVLIQDERLNPIFAYMWMSSRVSAQGYCTCDMPDGLQDEFHCIWPFKEPDLADLSFYIGNTPNPPSLVAHDQSPTPPLSASSGSSTIETTAEQFPSSHTRDHGCPSNRPIYLSLTFRLKLKLQSLFFPTSSAIRKRPPGLTLRTTAISQISPPDLRRRALALQAIQRYSLHDDLGSRHRTATSKRFYAPSLNIRIPFLDALQNNNLNPRLALRANNAVFAVAADGIVPGFAVAGALYGGLHLVAWNAPFPSSVERLLWRIAATSVTCTGLVFGILALAAKSNFAKRALSLTVWRAGKNVGFEAKAYFTAASKLCLFLFIGIVLASLPLLWFLYLLSRGYLVVASFKDIAYLSANAYDTPSWPSYIPHIT